MIKITHSFCVNLLNNSKQLPKNIYINKTISTNKNEIIIKSFYSTAKSNKLKTEINNNKIINDDFVSPQSKDKIQELLKLFPPIKYGFAYGSGVVIQKGYNESNITTPKDINNNNNNSNNNNHNDDNNNNKNNNDDDINNKNDTMIDLIFAVENSSNWHQLNLIKNDSHYSFLKVFGGWAISKYQKYGAKIYYNTLLEHNGIKFKYGVIEYRDLVDDLKNWRSLYVSGRMQKPIYNLPQSSEEGLNEITKINEESNLRNAVIASILQLPETFQNMNYIIEFVQFLTEAILDESINNDPSKLLQFKSSITPHNQINLIMMLPKKVSSQLLKTIRKNIIQKKTNETVQTDVHLDKSLKKIVRYSSFIQTLRGVLTAGILKSLNYTRLKLISSKKK
ncbi:hypothetical protein DICPUDRAFT_152302 [Dictyostelium purpureum]|uniref:Phosphatidate cytidylyltransferase, mitochondrial n=1 Tax=Dictyostelium purpureum TaxID=5786 RepID=F0ZL04_DICPU|nr:uncharacterized protein DICPUDRAFT_152302 [Dictyostelium purpureum]EGC35374.1 hypothetical protein DICPUDRAFT_152302 [Dictyostelium purpureum]|eukprot:XP_003288112.1 hypothetical protein DICPUDRAFT_152302 [Dictyostelium purpureum]